ncbi:hypothetical protein DESC_580126 [Desulfosarcina cetonica]|nr:hypothetical protein DESC_580126 [Desulfosarcina cetonica]
MDLGARRGGLLAHHAVDRTGAQAQSAFAALVGFVGFHGLNKLSGVENPLGIHAGFDLLHKGLGGVVDGHGQVVDLGQADAMLAREGAVVLDGQFEDFPVGRLHALPFLLVAGVGGDQRVHVTVAGMGQDADAQAVAPGDLADVADHVGHVADRHGGVLHDAIRRQAGEDAIGRATRRPEVVAFGGGTRLDHLGGAVAAGFLHDGPHLFFHGFLHAVHLDEEQPLGMARQTDAGRILHRVDHGFVHQLQGHGQDTRADDVRHGGRRGVQVVVDRQDRACGLGQWHHAQGDLGDDSEGAFRAAEKARQAVAGHVLDVAAAEADHLARGQDHFQAEHIIDGDPVFEAARAAGVLGHVAADGRDHETARVGWIEKPFLGQTGLQVPVDHAGLNDAVAVRGVDRDDAVHAREGEHDALSGRDRRAADAGAGAARRDRDAFAVGDGHDGRHLGGSFGQDHRLGHGLLHEGVVGVGQKCLRGIDIASGAHDGLEFGGCIVTQHGCFSRLADSEKARYRRYAHPSSLRRTPGTPPSLRIRKP